MKHLAKFAEYAEQRRAADQARKLLAEMHSAQQKLEAELVDAMVEDGVRSFQLEGGLTVSLRKRFDVSVNQSNNDQVADWLVESYGDITPFQKLVLYKPAVVAHLKKLASEDKLDETAVPAFLNLKTTPGVTVRGWQGSSGEDE